MSFWQVRNRRRDQKELRDERRNASEKGAGPGFLRYQDGRLALANAAMIEMTGFSLEETIGKPRSS